MPNQARAISSPIVAAMEMPTTLDCSKIASRPALPLIALAKKMETFVIFLRIPALAVRLGLHARTSLMAGYSSLTKSAAVVAGIHVRSSRAPLAFARLTFPALRTTQIPSSAKNLSTEDAEEIRIALQRRRNAKRFV